MQIDLCGDAVTQSENTVTVTDLRLTARHADTSGDLPLKHEQPSALAKWLSLALLGTAAMYLAARAAGSITDPDAWWHLRLGDDFRHGWSLSSPAYLSPFATKPWVPTQWLFEVSASFLNSAFGLSGVAWLTGVGVFAMAAALFAACRQEGTTLSASVAAMLSLLGATASISTRPQLVSFALLAVFMTAWLRTAEDLRARWWLIPVTYIWACSHGMWFIGPLTGVAVVAGMFFDRRLSARDGCRLLAIPILGVCAASLTPVGPRLILAPIAISRVTPYISEWQPTNFRQPCAFITATMLMVVVMSWSRTYRTDWSRVLLLVLACGWTALSLRTVALGAVMAAPLLAGVMHKWITTGPVIRMDRLERAVVAAALVVGLATLTILTAIRPVPAPPLSASVEGALAGLPTGTVVFNHDAFGGWLEWKHPNVAPVIDTMEDAYQPAYIVRYVAAMQLAPGWEAFMRQSGAHYALIYPSSPLAAELQRHWGWRPLASSPSAVLLTGKRP
jgi:hypothetical protein